jgi:hypothetical protein
MKSQVEKLGKDVLTQEEFDEAVSIARMYKQKQRAAVKKFFELDGKIGIPVPSHTHYPIEFRGVIRPIHFYCKVDIEHRMIIPRNFVSNICGHVESCAKLLLKKLDPAARTNIPLGPLLNKLKNFAISKDLIIKLETLNKVVYTRAKHDWNIPLVPHVHLFGTDDAIIIYFIARKLVKQIFDEGKIELQT